MLIFVTGLNGRSPDRGWETFTTYMAVMDASRGRHGCAVDQGDVATSRCRGCVSTFLPPADATGPFAHPRVAWAQLHHPPARGGSRIYLWELLPIRSPPPLIGPTGRTRFRQRRFYRNTVAIAALIITSATAPALIGPTDRPGTDEICRPRTYHHSTANAAAVQGRLIRLNHTRSGGAQLSV